MSNPPNTAKPNFLFIMSDQLRPDHTGFGGNPIVKTPNLDKLAARSKNFTKAYCNSPSCGPSRCSLTSGRMPSTIGSWTNAISLDPEANTFVRVLRKDGYKTGLVGKSHLQDCIDRRPSTDGSNMLDLSKLGLIRRPPKGEGRAVERSWQQDPDWDKWERHWLHKEGKVDMPKDYYGYDHVELTLNHDDRPGGHHYWWVKEQGGDPDQIGGLDNAIEPFEPWVQVWKSSCPLEYYTTNFITERSAAFIEDAVANDEPFFLTASFPDPHHPFGVPEPYYSMYDRDAITLPETFHNDHADGMPHLKRMAADRGADKRGPFSFSVSEEQYREATAVEYGSITHLDEGIGRLINKLEELGVADNTVIIFCADHGDLGGDHGLMLKFAAHYQGTIQVPFLIAGPGIQPDKTESMACLLDIGR
ncbi:MAG: sulfatase, partial [Anaerolineae bacterium]